MWLDNPPDACFDLVLTAQPVRADDFTSQSKMCDSNVLSKCKQKYASPALNKSLTRRDNAMAWRETEDWGHQKPDLLLLEAILQHAFPGHLQCAGATIIQYSVTSTHISTSFIMYS